MTDNCTWTQEEEDGQDWITSCGNSFMLMDEGPVNNGFKFCPFCGKSVTEDAWTDDA